MPVKSDHSVHEINPYGEEVEDSLSDDLSYQKVIESIAQQITKKRDIAVAFRAASGIEKRWRDDEAMFEGMLDSGLIDPSMLDYASGTAPAKSSNQPARSMIEINVVRNKCETAEGRFADIMLPVDSKNWALKVTPVPQITKALKDDRPAFTKDSAEPVLDADGEQLSMADVARKDFDRASDAMALMEKEIEDQLTECNYNAELRKIIKASCRLGTGIIKGPNVVKRVRKSYQQKTDASGASVHVLTAIEEECPASEEVSCWNIYPEPDTTEDIKKTMGHIFESGNIRGRELYDLIGVSGYDEKQIRLVLSEPPGKTIVETDKSGKKFKTRQLAGTAGSLYEIWYYYGDLSREDLEALDIDLSTTPEALMLSVAVVLVNDRPIKVMLNPLDSGDLPYDFFQWTQIADSPWGIGLTRMMFWIQRMINGTMRSMMDNAGDSSGVNVVIGGGLEPVDKKLELTGKKLWRYVGEDPQDIDVKKLFTQFQVANNQVELENIINLAFKFLDLETGVPMIFQGEQQKMPETLGATNIMVDASNVSLRSRVKVFDDQITDPHLSKYYHYNMQYNDKEEIKGDYAVDARGVSALYQREQYIQTLMQIMPFKNDPDFSLRIDWDKALKEMFSSLGLNILKSDTDYQQAVQQAQKSPPPPDPKLQVEELRAKSDMEELQAKSQDSESNRQAKARENQLDRDHALQLAAIQRDIKMMDFASRENISLDRVKTELSKTTMGLKTQIALSKDKTNPAPQVVTPPTEPPGRAADGRAYQD